MANRQGEHPCTAVEAEMSIPQQFGLSPSAFATRNFPGFAFLACGIVQFVAFLPPHHKAPLAGCEEPEPGAGIVSPIKHVAHLPSPVLLAWNNNARCTSRCCPPTPFS